MSRAETSLAELALDRSPDQVFWLDGFGRFIYVNQAACDALGYSRNDLLAMCIPDICPELHFDAWQKHWREIKQQGQMRFEAKQIRQDGSLLEVEISGNHVVFAEDEFACCYVRDISRYMEALHAKEHWLRIAQRNVKHFQALADIGLMIDKSINEICDFALEEAVRFTSSGVGYLHFYSEPTRQFSRYSWSSSTMGHCTVAKPQMTCDLENTGLWGEAVRQRRPIMINDFSAANPLKKGYPEGHAPLSRFLTIPVFDNAEIVAVVGVGNKATPYDDADVRQLQLFMDSAWRLICRRGMEEELRLARNAAEAANRSKSEFLAQLSHEIRTSMNGVIGMTELLHTTNVDEQQKEYLHILQSSADGLLFLINDTLDLARIEAGKFSLCMAEVSLKQIIHEVAESQRYMLGLKNLQLQLDLDDLPDQVIGDAQRLKQILLNLLVNALKFTESGQIALCARLLEQDSQKLLVRLSVADTGIGMDEDSLRRLFAPFEQATTETASRFGGSGLGLSICKKLTEMLGGTIEVESEAGKGSVFHVTLPFNLPCTAASRAAGDLNGYPSLDTIAPRRILIVEDNEMIQTLLCTLLQHAGHQGVCCSDGRSALEHVQNEHFDLILMDIRMPVMDGLQALHHIRAWEKRTGQRQSVIAITAHAMAGDREKYLRAGFDDYLSKPLKMHELTELLKKMLPTNPREKPAEEEHGIMGKQA